MAKSSSLYAALFAVAACIILVFTDGSQAGMAERAIHEREKRAALAESAYNKRGPTGNGTAGFRYLNDQTKSE